jgi:hypothetical protein
MKLYSKTLIMLMTIVTTIVLGKADGATSRFEVLDDNKLASIRGGFCPFEECEASATGVCEPVPPDQEDLCAVTKCIYEQETILSVTVYGCILEGDDTCTEPGSYRQCVWAFKLSYCSYGTVPVCGELIQADCLPNVAEEVCACKMVEPGSMCSWTNCNP